MEKLAIYGGSPVREQKIFYGRQCIEADDVQAVTETLQSSLITQGPMVKRMEEALCAYTGAKYAVAVCNGTAALHCAMMAAGIGEGDEVITTPITFAASANCALYCGATPVFADINEETYNIDPDDIERKITERTKAIVAVDFTGQVVEAEKIRRLCDKYNLIFIEDAAHSIGSKYKGTPVGKLADMTCFSFHPVKTITGGEGGAVMTCNEELYKRLSLVRTHGITHETKEMGTPVEGVWCYDEVELGYNYRITDFQGALVASQLNKIDRFVTRRKQIVESYNAAFADTAEIILQKEIDESDTCRHLYIIQLDLDKLNCTRREFFDALAAENVQPQVHYMPVYWFTHYRKLGYTTGLCPKAERLYSRIMSIPLYPLMTDEDVADVICAVKKVVAYYRK